MPRINILKVVLPLSLLIGITSLNAAVIAPSTNNYLNSARKMMGQEESEYRGLSSKENNDPVKQPKIAESDIAGISNSTLSKADQNGTVYRLKRTAKNTLGGSLHQSQLLKQFLGRNY